MVRPHFSLITIPNLGREKQVLRRCAPQDDRIISGFGRNHRRICKLLFLLQLFLVFGRFAAFVGDDAGGRGRALQFAGLAAGFGGGAEGFLPLALPFADGFARHRRIRRATSRSFAPLRMTAHNSG